MRDREIETEGEIQRQIYRGGEIEDREKDKQRYRDTDRDTEIQRD